MCLKTRVSPGDHMYEGIAEFLTAFWELKYSSESKCTAANGIRGASQEARCSQQKNILCCLALRVPRVPFKHKKVQSVSLNNMIGCKIPQLFKRLHVAFMTASNKSGINREACKSSMLN